MGRPRTITDEALLAATARVVAERGPIQFTLAEVAREAGVSAPLLVQRFLTKRGLLLALAAHAAESVEAHFADARAAHDDPLAALETALVALAGDSDPRHVANGLAFLQLDVTDGEFRAEALAFFESFHRETAALLEAATEQRALVALRADELARAVEVAYNGSMIVWALRQEGTVADAVRAGLAATLAPFRTTRTGRAARSLRALRPRDEGRASRGT